jgi:tetratricopeptide (TPR) repeat protein
VTTSSCRKEWLDAKPKKSLVVASTVQDFQAILDNSDFMFNMNTPSMGAISAEEYFLDYPTWASISYAPDKNAYIWSEDIFQGQASGDWNNAYSRILTANIVVDGIAAVPVTGENSSDWNNVKGSALFYRAFDYYNLSQLYCKAYDESTADTDLGLPLRLSPDINEKSKRATLRHTYQQITGDLQVARNLLPASPAFKTRPSLPGVFALLARIHLSMEDYTKAKLYADSCLQLQNALLDFNTIDTALLSPIGNFNPEVIFHSTMAGALALFFNRAIVNEELINAYDEHDLRKAVMFKFYDSQMRFHGSYAADFNNFSGLATDEVYLIRAECQARAGKIDEAIEDLNTLLEQRWQSGSFVPVSATDQTSVLHMILMERRKELYMRGLRWSDLRRLNKDPLTATTIQRNLDGQVYQLPPGDSRFVLPIPPDEIRLSGLEQNPR